MPRLLPILALCALAAGPVSAETIGGNPGPAYNYVCPNSDGKPALDCFFDAVRHLYTMCRQVKSIEIIEFGYEEAQQGVNGAKSESCVDKQKLNMTRPYQAALREASVSKQVVEGVRALHEAWLDALARLRWTPGESDDDYKSRTTRVYELFEAKIGDLQSGIATARATQPVKAVATKASTRTASGASTSRKSAGAAKAAH